MMCISTVNYSAALVLFSKLHDVRTRDLHWVWCGTEPTTHMHNPDQLIWFKVCRRWPGQRFISLQTCPNKLFTGSTIYVARFCACVLLLGSKSTHPVLWKLSLGSVVELELVAAVTSGETVRAFETFAMKFHTTLHCSTKCKILISLLHPPCCNRNGTVYPWITSCVSFSLELGAPKQNKRRVRNCHWRAIKHEIFHVNLPCLTIFEQFSTQ